MPGQFTPLQYRKKAQDHLETAANHLRRAASNSPNTEQSKYHLQLALRVESVMREMQRLKRSASQQ